MTLNNELERRVDELLEANNAYLQRAHDAEKEVRRLNKILSLLDPPADVYKDITRKSIHEAIGAANKHNRSRRDTHG